MIKMLVGRTGTHYDAIPHGNCADPGRCDCECDGCLRSWVAAGSPVPVAVVQVQADCLAHHCAALTSELAEARRQLGEAVEVQEDLAGKLFDAVRERDALKAGKWAGAWEPPNASASVWTRRNPYRSAVCRVNPFAMAWALSYGTEAYTPAASLDAAKAAADTGSGVPHLGGGRGVPALRGTPG